MSRDHPILGGIVGGLTIGLLLLILRRLGVNTGFAVPALIGILLVILDYQCLKPVFDGRRYEKLLNFGSGTDARIEEIVSAAVHPKYFVMDENGKPVLPENDANIPKAYTLRLKYTVNGREYSREVFTPAKTATEIYPYVITEGATVPIKYSGYSPRQMIISIPSIAEEVLESKREFRFKGPFTAFVMTAIYVIFLYIRYF